MISIYWTVQLGARLSGDWCNYGPGEVLVGGFTAQKEIREYGEWNLSSIICAGMDHEEGGNPMGEKKKKMGGKAIKLHQSANAHTPLLLLQFYGEQCNKS